MEFTIIIDVRRRTQELTISEIVSREIDPVLFLLPLSTDNSLKRNIGILLRALRS